MSYQEKYQRAKEAGYSDQEIMEYLAKKDPSFEQKMVKAQESGYTPEEVLHYFNTKPAPKKQDTAELYAKDVIGQGAQGFGIGSLGTYGDILDLLGLQSKEILPGEKAKYQRESDILERMQKGHKPSAGELMELSDEDVAPRFSRLASSQDVEQLGGQLGLVSEPKTAAGRYAKRIGRIGGGGAVLGAGGIASPIAAGIAGQTLEEIGAPPWAQAAAEIIAGLKFSPKTNVPVTSKSKEVEKIIADLRKAGYSEKDITLAKSALEDRKILKKFSTLTRGAENAIEQGVKNSEELFKQQIKKGLPGYAEGGLPYLEKQANNVYRSMEELASSVPIKNKEPVRKAVNDAIAYLEKYPLLDEQKKFIEFMKDGVAKLDKADTAEFFTGFYRNLGKAGNWGNPTQKEHLLGMVKEGIKKTFAESGPEGAKFGKYFEKTNEAWKHWLNTRDLMETIEKASTVEGMNFKRLSSILDKPENHELAKKVLGPEQLQNIKSITKGAEAIESLLKQIPKSNKTIMALEIIGALTPLISGNYKPMIGILGYEATRRLATRLLINPKTQNTMKKIITAAKNNSPQQAAILAQELVSEPEE
jgi:CheY-like chemotaxis protein